MNRYQLAKVVQWAGTPRSRKRMQKIIFLKGKTMLDPGNR